MTGDGGPAHHGREGAGGAADDDVLRRRALEPHGIDEDVEEVARQGRDGGGEVDLLVEDDEGGGATEDAPAENLGRRQAARGQRPVAGAAHDGVDVPVVPHVDGVGAAAGEGEAEHTPEGDVQRRRAAGGHPHGEVAGDQQQDHHVGLPEADEVPGHGPDRPRRGGQRQGCHIGAAGDGGQRRPAVDQHGQHHQGAEEQQAVGQEDDADAGGQLQPYVDSAEGDLGDVEGGSQQRRGHDRLVVTLLAQGVPDAPGGQHAGGQGRQAVQEVDDHRALGQQRDELAVAERPVGAGGGGADAGHVAAQEHGDVGGHGGAEGQQPGLVFRQLQPLVAAVGWFGDDGQGQQRGEEGQGGGQMRGHGAGRQGEDNGDTAQDNLQTEQADGEQRAEEDGPAELAQAPGGDQRQQGQHCHQGGGEAVAELQQHRQGEDRQAAGGPGAAGRAGARGFDGAAEDHQQKRQDSRGQGQSTEPGGWRSQPADPLSAT